MDRVAVFRLLERAAQPVRRAGLGGAVDAVRGRFERGLGEFTEEIDGLKVTGGVAAHADYVAELREDDREGAMTRRWVEAARPGATVVDVGGHLGWLTMQAARAVGPKGHVVTFEPNPETRPLLERNLRDNGLVDRVSVLPYAVADGPGHLTFYVSIGGDTSSLHRQDPGDRPVEVEVVAADAVLAGRAPVSAIKLDVEGGELAALAGLRSTIAGADPALELFVECNPTALAKAGASADALWDALLGLGLAPQIIDEATGELRGREALGSIVGYANLVCARSPG